MNLQQSNITNLDPGEIYWLVKNPPNILGSDDQFWVNASNDERNQAIITVGVTCEKQGLHLVKAEWMQDNTHMYVQFKSSEDATFFKDWIISEMDSK